ncbi:class I SAM-dependent methyltransferase [Pelagibacterium montanilacus]|uniref:class I SAM-dependent methyltransferase n=1 Tax=Pelagibacterium montanilacus TaxID=2185280 RepID=UPI000F8F698C|nr:class I SAM-dependent methyltransferase [Pelagibacterium montanilacus]
MRTCRVCVWGFPAELGTFGGHLYWRCPECQATLLDPVHYLPLAEERAHYLTHKNDVDDPGYRRFLERVAGPLRSRLRQGASGLDYGCGPGPALAAMLGEAGFSVALYDPAFAPDRNVLERSYDFVTCTETAEHFHDPAAEFARLMALVVPGGWLAIMTCFQTDDARFGHWHYRLDPTHVVFYRETTLAHIAAAADWSWVCPGKDVVLMQRPAGDRVRDSA